MIINNLYHGSDDSFIQFKSDFVFFFIGNPELASTYGTNVYECSADVNNTFDLEEGNDLEKSASGTRYAGTSLIIKTLIRNVLHELPESDIHHALEMYRRHGIGTVSPARIFLDRYDLLVKYLSKLGYDSIKFRDESMMGSSQGTFPAIMVFNPQMIKIDKIIVYDDYYGDVEREYTLDQWKQHNSEKLLESFINTIAHHDKSLLESIMSGYKLIFDV